MLAVVGAAGSSICLLIGRVVRVRLDKSLCAGEPGILSHGMFLRFSRFRQKSVPSRFVFSNSFFRTPHCSFAETIGLRVFRTTGHVQEVPRSGKVTEVWLLNWVPLSEYSFCGMP